MQDDKTVLDTSATRDAPAVQMQNHSTKAGWLLCLASILLAISCLLSLTVGAQPLSLAAIEHAVFSFSGSLYDTIFWSYRVPRTLLAVLCGAAFGVAGALIQAATRNPLADPGILGVNAGASFLVTIAVGYLGFRSIDAYVWFSFAGAIGLTVIVYLMGTRGKDGTSSVRLVLCGIAFSAFLMGISSGMTILDPQLFDAMRLWHLGSVAGRDMAVVTTVLPFILAGLMIALATARSLNAISMGDDIAHALGVSVVRARILVVAAITLLCGAATAAAGPVGFVGLMVPHVVRWTIGPDQRWIILLTMILSAALLLVADVVGRVILFPDEIQAGIITAFIGAPVLIFLARGRTVTAL